MAGPETWYPLRVMVCDNCRLVQTEDFAAVDEACGIDSTGLLAERYVKEMEDDAQTPRLLDILVRSEM